MGYKFVALPGADDDAMTDAEMEAICKMCALDTSCLCFHRDEYPCCSNEREDGKTGYYIEA